MKLRFQADANLESEIGLNLRRINSAIDYQLASGSLRDGLSDPEVPALCADQQRVLVTRDIRTMSCHFRDFTLQRSSPGIILIPSGTTIGEVIRGVVRAWEAWPQEEMVNQARWLLR